MKRSLTIVKEIAQRVDRLRYSMDLMRRGIFLFDGMKISKVYIYRNIIFRHNFL